MRRHPLDTYHIGDAREIPGILPGRRFVDVTITSPPYWNLKDYRSRKQVGYGQAYEAYLDELERIFGAVYRITKRTGSLWVVVDTIKHKGELKLFPFDLALRLKKVGWFLHDIIIWNKDKTLPWSHRGKLRNIFEYILFFSKSRNFKYFLSRVREADDLKTWWIRYPERYSPQGKAPTRAWSIPIPRQGSWGENWVRHFCPFPPELVRRIILLTTEKGDVVLDPFCGSGVVLAQAKAQGRRYVGIDLRKSYRRMFQSKVLPSLERLETLDPKESLEREKRRREFSSLIWRLRKVKYPRELMRLYEKEYGKQAAIGALALSLTPRSLNVTLVSSSQRRASKYLASRFKKIMHRPPLSKYGLAVTLSIVPLQSRPSAVLSRRGIDPRAKLQVFENGKAYQASREASAREFLDMLKRSDSQMAPPIATNIRVATLMSTRR